MSENPQFYSINANPLLRGQLSEQYSVVTMVELRDCNIKLDHSLGCPDDAPNWRLVPGFPIYGVGQPTNDGFNKVFSRRERYIH